MLGNIIKAMTKLLNGDFSGASEEMAKYGNLMADSLRKTGYGSFVQDYVTPIVRPITNVADSVANETINIYQDLRSDQASNRQGQIAQSRIAEQQKNAANKAFRAANAQAN